jgi:hypothetical protein
MFDMAKAKENFLNWLRSGPKVKHRPRVLCVCDKFISLKKDGTPMAHKCVSADKIADAMIDRHMAIDPAVADMRANAGDYHNPTVIGEA